MSKHASHLPTFRPLTVEERRTSESPPASFNLKNLPVRKDKVPDAHYEADAAARIFFLGDENAVQSDSKDDELLRREVSAILDQDNTSKKLAQVSVDLSRSPLRKGEVPTPYYEADRKMREMMLGDAQVVNSSVLPQTFVGSPS